jgi:hypothetical protein
MRKAKLFGHTLGFVEWTILLLALAVGTYKWAQKEETPPPAEAPVAQIASILGYDASDSHINVEVWLMKYRLEFDKADKDYQVIREINFLRKSFLEKCFIETAAKDKYNRLSDVQVQSCLKEADTKTEEAQAYWSKK